MDHISGPTLNQTLLSALFMEKVLDAFGGNYSIEQLCSAANANVYIPVSVNDYEEYKFLEIEISTNNFSFYDHQCIPVYLSYNALHFFPSVSENGMFVSMTFREFIDIYKNEEGNKSIVLFNTLAFELPVTPNKPDDPELIIFSRDAICEFANSLGIDTNKSGPDLPHLGFN